MLQVGRSFQVRWLPRSHHTVAPTAPPTPISLHASIHPLPVCGATRPGPRLVAAIHRASLRRGRRPMTGAGWACSRAQIRLRIDPARWLPGLAVYTSASPVSVPPDCMPPPPPPPPPPPCPCPQQTTSRISRGGKPTAQGRHPAEAWLEQGTSDPVMRPSRQNSRARSRWSTYSSVRHWLATRQQIARSPSTWSVSRAVLHRATGVSYSCTPLARSRTIVVSGEVRSRCRFGPNTTVPVTLKADGVQPDQASAKSDVSQPWLPASTTAMHARRLEMGLSQGGACRHPLACLSLHTRYACMLLAVQGRRNGQHRGVWRRPRRGGRVGSRQPLTPAGGGLRSCRASSSRMSAYAATSTGSDFGPTASCLARRQVRGEGGTSKRHVLACMHSHPHRIASQLSPWFTLGNQVPALVRGTTVGSDT